jgi:hypothetical protein
LSLAATKPVQEELGLRHQAAPDLLLELVGHGPDQEITAEGGWGRAAEELAVSRPHLIARQVRQAGEGRLQVGLGVNAPEVGGRGLAPSPLLINTSVIGCECRPVAR